MSEETAIGVKLDMLHADVNDMKVILRDLTTAINRLAVVEERQMQTAQSLGRAFKIIEKLEARVSSLEVAQPETKRTNDWVGRAVWAAAAAAGVYAGKKIGLL